MPTMFEESPSAGANATDGEYIQPTLNDGLRIWWAFYWRNTLIVSILLAALILAVIPFVLRGAITVGTLRSVMSILPWVISYAVSIPVFYFILRKRFRHYRIALIVPPGGPGAEELPPTLPRTLRVWWTFTWRTVVYRLVVGFLLSLPLGLIVGTLSEMFPRWIGTFVFLEVSAVEVVVGLYVIYSNILDEDFAGFRVSLLRRTAAAPVRAATAAIPPAAI